MMVRLQILDAIYAAVDDLNGILPFERAMSRRETPFATVASLADDVAERLEASGDV